MKQFSFSIFISVLFLSACGVRLAEISPSIPVLPATAAVLTPVPYDRYTISYLRTRTYGAGQIELTTQTEDHALFKRYYFNYPSDGLNIYGFMNVPDGDGPFPVVIILHGKNDLATYSSLDYLTPYADKLAEAGYLVLHPNLRDYPPSDSGDNLYRTGMAVDVLNLIALVKTEGGQAGPLAQADPARIGLWGHSMGGGIALKVITVSSDIKAALLYAPLSGEEKLNFKRIFSVPDNSQAEIERTTATDIWFQVSPFYYFGNITAAVSIHHGRRDRNVLFEWSQTTCDRLIELGKNVDCVYYDDMGHIFYGADNEKFITLSTHFFDTYLKGTAEQEIP